MLRRGGDRALGRAEELAPVRGELQRETAPVAGVGFSCDEPARDQAVDDGRHARRAHREAVRERGRRAGAVTQEREHAVLRQREVEWVERGLDVARQAGEGTRGCRRNPYRCHRRVRA